MDASAKTRERTYTDIKAHFDAIVIGAGFGGMYTLIKLRDEQGLNVRVFDRASDVGGTWHWNRYPGAMSDTPTHLYCYSFDDQLLQDWNWNTEYVFQPQILSYLKHVADRYDLRRNIQFNTGIEAAHFDEKGERWIVFTDAGEKFSAKYLVTALGLLSAPVFPDIKGLKTFEGELHHTGGWPEGTELKGKRVGVVGTGSSGVQFICASASQVDHLTVFQRTPQYSVPAHRGPSRKGIVPQSEVDEIKSRYTEIWDEARNTMLAFGITESEVPAMSVSEEEREAVFQKAWDEGGGFRYMFATFSDIITNKESNEAAASFIRKKIAEIVKDPETARKLTPHDYYARRPLCDIGYYDTFNRDNVTLEDVKANPIAEITPKGVKLEDGTEHELDMLVFATGFQAVDGAYSVMDIQGRGGADLGDLWKNGPTSYMGITVPGFPNMFMIMGPHGPFTNLPPSIEAQTEWIADSVAHMERQGLATLEVKANTQASWIDHCHEVATGNLFAETDSWIFGVNIPGKPHALMFYMGGLKAYRTALAEEQDGGYPGFVAKPVAEGAAAQAVGASPS